MQSLPDHTTQSAGTPVTLTANEIEQARQQAARTVRTRLDQRKPHLGDYTSESRASQLISDTLLWSKALVPLVAILAAIASAVRTLQTSAEIYAASGSHPVGVAIAAIAFTFSVEGSLFFLALAQEGQYMKLRAAKRPRHVTSLASVWYGVQVRIGTRQPLRHDEIPEGDGGLNLVIGIAFAFAVTSNLFLGMRPLLEQIGSMSFQAFIGSLLNADARIQITFLVDLAAVLFPPFMALKAGHLTARFAAEIAQAQAQVRAAFERDLEQWRDQHANPLVTAEGQEVLNTFLREKLNAKQIRREMTEKARRLAEIPVQAESRNAAMVENAEKPELAESGGTKAEKGGLSRGEAKARLEALFRDNPSVVHLPVEALMELSGAKKSAVYEWRKLRQNGHGTGE